MASHSQTDSKIRKRNFEMTLHNAEKLLNERIQQTMSHIHTPRMFERANRKKIVLNKSPIFKKWINSSAKQTYVFSLEIMQKGANKAENMEKISKTFPDSIK